MILEIKNLSFSYPNGLKALEDISCSLEEGKTLGIAGGNGAGKSTLLFALAGLFPKKFLQGSINSRGKEIALVFQNPDDQIIGSTVEDDVGFSLLRKKENKGKVKLEVKRILEKVLLSGFEKRSPFELSFGEKKRLSIASVLIGEPEIVLLDEPSLGLDFRQRRQIIEILKDLKNTLIIASHDLDLIRELAETVLILDKARLVARGNTREILGNSAFLRNYGME